MDVFNNNVAKSHRLDLELKSHRVLKHRSHRAYTITLANRFIWSKVLKHVFDRKEFLWMFLITALLNRIG